jgi:hypothetical protein
MYPFRILNFSLLLLLVCYFVNVSAQRITFEGGMLAGFHRSDFIGEKEKFWHDDYDRSAIAGISASPFVKMNINPDLYSLLEIRYMRKGCKFGYANKIFTQSFETVILDYIEIPLMIGVNGVFTSTTGPTNYSFETGFAFSRLYSSKLKLDEGMKRANPVSIEQFRNFDISWIARVKLPGRTFKRHMLLWGFRLENSLLSIHPQYKLRNFSFGIELNYLFRNL